MRVDVVDNMKQSVINDFYNYIQALQQGKHCNKTNSIITKILFINSISGLNKVDHIYQKLI